MTATLNQNFDKEENFTPRLSQAFCFLNKAHALEDKLEFCDVDSVVSFESFKSNSESFRALKLSLFESFRVIRF